MTDTPEYWPRISSALFYTDAAKAIDFLCKAFGFEVRLKIEGEGGRIEHSELLFQEGLIMVGTAGGKTGQAGRPPCASPRSVGGANTQSLCLNVDDVDAHCAKARAAGAKIVSEPTTHDYGEEYGAHRSYGALDTEGHHWSFMRNVRGPKKQ